MKLDNIEVKTKFPTNVFNSEVFRQSYGLIQSIAVLLLLIVTISLLYPRFISATNISNLMSQMAVMLVVAAGMTIVMISGEFDIAVGSELALTAAISAILMVKLQLGIPLSIALSLLVGPVIGLISGILVTKGKIPSFIVTLGTMMMARSLTFVVTQGQVIGDIPDAFKKIAHFHLLGIPLNFIIALLVYLIGWILLTRTTYGKKVYAVGSNRTVALLSGIRADWIKIRSFLLVGLTASVGGNLLLSRIGAIHADTGRGLEFEVIAAVVIGGTSLNGGQGNILRTIIGVIIISLIRNFLNLARIDIFWQDFATGAIIVFAVLLDAFQKRITQRAM